MSIATILKRGNEKLEILGLRLGLGFSQKSRFLGRKRAKEKYRAMIGLALLALKVLLEDWRGRTFRRKISRMKDISIVDLFE